MKLIPQSGAVIALLCFLACSLFSGCSKGAKLGGYLMDDMVVYGAAGAGWLANTPSYAFGVGVEKAVMDTVSVRADLLGTGSWGGGPNGIKASVGVLWHMN